MALTKSDCCCPFALHPPCLPNFFPLKEKSLIENIASFSFLGLVPSFICSTKFWKMQQELDWEQYLVEGVRTDEAIVLDLSGLRDDGGVSGRGKSEDGKLSYGYTCRRAHRVTMDGTYDIQISTINGQSVCMFGIFDGHFGVRAAQHLKLHLFYNLMKHPQLMTNTQLAISETFQQTDVDFLDLERLAYRDDGSAAITAVVVGNHLYVAHVGDSRGVASKKHFIVLIATSH